MLRITFFLFSSPTFLNWRIQLLLRWLLPLSWWALSLHLPHQPFILSALNHFRSLRCFQSQIHLHHLMLQLTHLPWPICILIFHILLLQYLTNFIQIVVILQHLVQLLLHTIDLLFVILFHLVVSLYQFYSVLFRQVYQLPYLHLFLILLGYLIRQLAIQQSDTAL